MNSNQIKMLHLGGDSLMINDDDQLGKTRWIAFIEFIEEEIIWIVNCEHFGLTIFWALDDLQTLRRIPGVYRLEIIQAKQMSTVLPEV